MKKLLPFLFFSLVGCASVSQTYAPDGKKAYALNCSGTARGWDKCQKSAGEICGSKGYRIIEKSSERMVAIGGSTSGFAGAETNERSMLITCN